VAAPLLFGISQFTDLEDKELLDKLAGVVGTDVVNALTDPDLFFKTGRLNRSSCARKLKLRVKDFDALWETMRETLAEEE
jgi:hypothetical protein